MKNRKILKKDTKTRLVYIDGWWYPQYEKAYFFGIKMWKFFNINEVDLMVVNLGETCYIHYPWKSYARLFLDNLPRE